MAALLDKGEVQILLLCMFGIFRTVRSVCSVAGIMAEPFPFSVSYVTVPNEDVANKLAEYITNDEKVICHASVLDKGLVSQKLAACVNIIPGVKSVYEWEGKIQKDSELLMMIKSKTSRLEELTKYVRENHPYEVCEVISMPIHQGNPAYLKWLENVIPDK